MQHPKLEAGLLTSSNSFCAGLSYLAVHVYCFGSPPLPTVRRGGRQETSLPTPEKRRPDLLSPGLRHSSGKDLSLQP